MDSSSFAIENRRRNYDKVSLQKRQLLVQMVDDGNTISSVAKEIGIKYSTAKLIYKRFRQTGTFYESKKMKTERKRVTRQEDSKSRPRPNPEQTLIIPTPTNMRKDSVSNSTVPDSAPMVPSLAQHSFLPPCHPCPPPCLWVWHFPSW